MMKKVIGIRPESGTARPAATAFAGGQLADTLRRPMRDLRISVTDRCNFRSVYCMPPQGLDPNYRFLPHTAILGFEQIPRLAPLSAALRRTKITVPVGS